MARSVEHDRRDIAAAEAAAGQMQEGTAPEAVQPADVEAARAKAAELRAERKRHGAHRECRAVPPGGIGLVRHRRRSVARRYPGRDPGRGVAAGKRQACRPG
ncbi:hypothetical protein G6F53_014132 [Rhizopus delemar]|nr:hypothetical protein G6F53_014132 [Rhizopus delemar]